MRIVDCQFRIGEKETGNWGKKHRELSIANRGLERKALRIANCESQPEA